MWTWVGSVNDDLIGQAEKAIPGYDGMKLAMTRIGDQLQDQGADLAGRQVAGARHRRDQRRRGDVLPERRTSSIDLKSSAPTSSKKRLPALEVEARDHAGRQDDGLPDGHRPDRAVLPHATSSRRPASTPTRPRSPSWRPTGTAYIELGKKLKQAVPGSAITDNITGVFRYALAQQSEALHDRGRPVHRRPGPHPRGVRPRDPGGQGRAVRERAGRYDRRQRRRHQRQAGRLQRCGLVGPARAEERGPEDEGTLAGDGGSWWRRQPWRVLPGDHEVLQEPRGGLRVHQLAGVGEEPGPGVPRPGAVPVHPGQLHRRADGRTGPVLRRSEDRRRVRRVGEEVSRVPTSRPYDTIIGTPIGAELVNVESRRQVAGPGLGGRAAARSNANSPERGRSEMAVTSKTLPATVSTTKDPGPSKPPSKYRQALPQYAAISPFFILFAVFGAFPVLFSIWISFHSWDGIGADEVGRAGAVQLPAHRSEVLAVDRQHADHLGAVDRPDAAAGAGDRQRAAQRDPVPQLLPDRLLHPERHLGGRRSRWCSARSSATTSAC